MTGKKVLDALRFRLDSLKKVYKALEKAELPYVSRDYEIRIDELESLYEWIKTNGTRVKK